MRGFLIAIAYPDLFRRTFTDAPGTARWATIKDLQKAKVVGETVDPAHDLYCGVFEHKKKLIPIHEDSDRHVATLGSTRRGKGNGLLVQALAQIDESFVVLDPAGELAAMTYEVRAKKGPVFVLNPFGVLTDTSDPDIGKLRLPSPKFRLQSAFGNPRIFLRDRPVLVIRLSLVATSTTLIGMKVLSNSRR